MTERILFIPECGKGHGSGHMVRSLRIAALLESEIYLPVSCFLKRSLHLSPYQFAATVDEKWKLSAFKQRIHTELPRGVFDKVVFDIPHLRYAMLYSVHARMTIGLDCGGEARISVSYLIDTLPNFYDDANIHSVAFNVLPQMRRENWPKEIKKIFISFGGEDSGQKATIVKEKLLQENSAVSVDMPKGVFQKKNMYRILDALHLYDVLITHFGLLAYEGLWARVPVLLINPTRYHERLSQKAGFVCFPNNKDLSLSLLKSLFPQLSYNSQQIAPRSRKDIVALIQSLQPSRYYIPYATATARFTQRSFFHIGRGTIVQARYRDTQRIYEDSYFSKEYAEQYGRTYLQDADAIYSIGKIRLKRINKYMSSKNILLDIGCAYGHFLRAAKDNGYQVYGIDISQSAIHYVQQTLRISARQIDVQNDKWYEMFPLQHFSVISLWYVLEHLQDPFNVLKKLLPLLQYKGVLCFSMPNPKGASARLKKQSFYQESPEDHFVLWDPFYLRTMFKSLGLRLKYIRFTGHHPERFLLPLAKMSFASVIYKGMSKVFGLGDTFEAYFIKDSK